MAPPSVRACTDARTKQFVDCELRTGQKGEPHDAKKLGACAKPFPEVLCHGTKLTNLCDILRDGFLNPL